MRHKIIPDVPQKYIPALLCPADPLDPHSELEGEAPDGSYANRNGRHAIGHVDDFSALQQQVLEGRSLVQHMETTLQACLGPSLLDGNQKDGSELVRSRFFLFKLTFTATELSHDCEVTSCASRSWTTDV